MTVGKVTNCCAKAGARQLYNSQRAVVQIYQPHLQSGEFPDACTKFKSFNEWAEKLRFRQGFRVHVSENSPDCRCG